jgi:hypothetical protein
MALISWMCIATSPSHFDQFSGCTIAGIRSVIELVRWDGHHREGIYGACVSLAPPLKDNSYRNRFAVVRRDHVLFGSRRRDLFFLIECSHHNQSAPPSECIGECRFDVDRL